MAKPSVKEAKDLVEFLEDVARYNRGVPLDVQIQQWICIIEIAKLVRGELAFDELSECTIVFIEAVQSA